MKDISKKLVCDKKYPLVYLGSKINALVVTANCKMLPYAVMHLYATSLDCLVCLM